jgi:hypothetical protein
MNKVLGAVILHYGKDYFDAALQSIKDHVEEIVVFYTATPSHGTNTRLTCPDTREELREIALRHNCTWIEISSVSQENKHREMYIAYGEHKGYDQVLIIDSDEVHIPEEVPKLLEAASNCNVKRVGVEGSQWITPYRSFNEHVTDGFAPIRVINLKKPEGQENVKEGFIYHMGYCIPDKLMEYKISCHGHRADFEKNRNWMKDKWLNFNSETRYLHPATEAYWIETKPLDKTTLPQVLKEHPNYNLDRIC